jgi:hypothetical protein
VAIETGAVFRAVQGHRLTAAALGTDSVARVVKQNPPRVGLDPAVLRPCHSLRSGSLTSEVGRIVLIMGDQIAARSAG